MDVNVVLVYLVIFTINLRGVFMVRKSGKHLLGAHYMRSILLGLPT